MDMISKFSQQVIMLRYENQTLFRSIFYQIRIRERELDYLQVYAIGIHHRNHLKI